MRITSKLSSRQGRYESVLYEISEMYKRDTSFILCESENAIQFSDVQNCKMISFINGPLKYQTDRID